MERFGKRKQAIDAREVFVARRRFDKGAVGRIKIFCLRRASAQKHAFAYDMLATQVKLWLQRQTTFTILRRIAIAVLLTIAFTAVLNRPVPVDHAAGFVRGLVDGAIMPGAMPPLLLGRDVSIYAAHNTGRTYKLGYTVGVNGCGALFFGIVYWRFVQWKKRNSLESSRAQQSAA